MPVVSSIEQCKIFHIHVGNIIHSAEESERGPLVERLSFDDNKFHWYSKHDIINADTQMQSLLAKGLDIDYGHFSNRKSILKLWQAGLKLRKLCNSNKYDLIHVFWGSTTALMTILFASKPVVISFSGSDLLGLVNSKGDITLSGRISRALSIIAAYLADSLITKSEEMKNILPLRLRIKTTVVPNGVDFNNFYLIPLAEARTKLGWQSDCKVVLFFGSGGAPVKNARLAMKTFSKVKESLPNAVFNVIDGGVDHEELVYYYNAADAMLLTSFHEGSNNSLKEAMACNLPIISVACGDAPERLGGLANCYVSKAYNSKELSEAVIRILQTGKRSNGRDFIEELSLSRVADRIIDVYKRALQI